MSRRLSLVTALLAGLILGQWLLLLHAADHDPLVDQDVTCHICLHGHAAMHVPPAAVAVACLAHGAQAIAVKSVPYPSSSLYLAHTIRAPPA